MTSAIDTGGLTRRFGRTEAVRDLPDVSFGAPFGFTAAGQHEVVKSRRSTISGAVRPHPAEPPLDREWFTGAQLVIVRTTQAAFVERRLDVPRVAVIAK